MAIELLTWVAAALTAFGGTFVVVLALRRVHVARATRRRREAEARLRPLALALAEGEETSLDEIRKEDVVVLADLLGRYARWLSGRASEEIGRFFERTGNVDRASAALGHRTGWRRATAAFVLGDMGSPRAIPALVEALRDRDRDVRSAAARSLGRLGAVDAVEPLAYALVRGEIPRAVSAQALLAIGRPALPAVTRLARADEAEVRALAVELIGLLGDAADAERIVPRLRDGSAEVRAKAARALGRLGAEDAAAALREALADRVPFVRAAAAHAIGAIADRDAVPALFTTASRDPFFDAASAAARALARIDPDLVLSASVRPDAGPHLTEAADLFASSR